MWAVFVLSAAAQPSSLLIEGPAAVEAALAGPAGCWQVEGTARWRHTWGEREAAGDARFWAIFEDHRWELWRVGDRAEHIVWGGGAPDQLASRQFRSQIGQDLPSTLSLESGAVLMRGPPFTEDGSGIVASARPRADGIELLDPRSGELAQEWTLRGDHLERCRTTFHPGTVTPASVWCDQDPHASGVGRGMESDRRLYFSPEGHPTEEIGTYAGRLPLTAQSAAYMRLMYERWTPCPEGAAERLDFVPDRAVELLPDLAPEIWLDPAQPPTQQEATVLTGQHRLARRRFHRQLAFTGLYGGLTAALVVSGLTEREWTGADAVVFGLGVGVSAAGTGVGAFHLGRRARDLREAREALPTSP